MGLVAAMVIIGVLLVSGLTHRVVDRAHAQAAADATALAGVADGRPAAEAIARANDVVLISFDEDENHVTVEISTPDGMQAIATAERRLEAFD